MRYSSGSLSLLLNIEATIFEAENRTIVFHQDWEDLLLLGGVLPRASVDKHILLPVVPVNITAKS